MLRVTRWITEFYARQKARRQSRMESITPEKALRRMEVTTPERSDSAGRERLQELGEEAAGNYWTTRTLTRAPSGSVPPVRRMTPLLTTPSSSPGVGAGAPAVMEPPVRLKATGL